MVKQQIVDNYDCVIECKQPFPVDFDKLTSLNFQIPSGKELLINPSRINIEAAFQFTLIDGSPVIEEAEYTIIEEPLLNCIKTVIMTVNGKPCFTINSYNYCNYINKLTVKRIFMEEYFGMTGYGLDSPPMNDPTIGFQKKRFDQLNFSIPWYLTGPLYLPQFASADCPLLPSELDLGLEFEFESSDFMVIRNEKKSHYMKARLLSFNLGVNYAVTKVPIPLKAPIKIPYTSQQVFKYTGSAGVSNTSSGHILLENYPSKAIIFFTPDKINNDLINPFDFQTLSCTHLNVSVDGKDHSIAIDSGLEDFASTYSSIHHVLARQGLGFSRTDMQNGYFIVGIDLSHVVPSKKGCVVSVSTRHHSGLPQNISVYCMFYSAGVFSVASNMAVQDVLV